MLLYWEYLALPFHPFFFYILIKRAGSDYSLSMVHLRHTDRSEWLGNFCYGEEVGWKQVGCLGVDIGGGLCGGIEIRNKKMNNKK